MHRFSTYFVFLVLAVFKTTQGDYYSSLLNVEKLIKSEGDILKKIEEYIERTENLLDQCEKALDIWQENHERDMQNPEEFVKVPTNGFKLIKRNTADMDLLFRRFLIPAVDDFLNMTGTLDSLPDQKDMYETSWALAKLSYTYDIPFTSMFLDGELWIGEDMEYYRPLFGDEIMVFFRQLFSVKWNLVHHLTNECIELIDGALKQVSMMRDERKTHRTLTLYVETMTFLLTEISPFALKAINDRVLDYFGEVDQVIDFDEKIIKKMDEVRYADKTKAEKYKQLCQGRGVRSSKLLSKLNCYYQRQSRSHFLLIAPVKVEQLNLDPEILLYHDILTDVQMEALKTAAAPYMARSTVTFSSSRVVDPVVSPIRLTHSVKLKPTDSTTVKDVELLTEDVTGLDKNAFEELSINIYGVGGYYLQHMDSSQNETKKRTATMLFYLSDVELGGSTIFPHFNLTVPARKGKALLWYNLHTSGEIDNRMTHSACPVLLGYKWIGTYWIRQLGQTFTRPCVPNELHTTLEDFKLSLVMIPELSQQ